MISFPRHQACVGELGHCYRLGMCAVAGVPSRGIRVLFLALCMFTWPLLVYTQVHSCALAQKPDPGVSGSNGQEGAERPVPLPLVTPGNVTSSEYGSGSGTIPSIPYTISAVYGSSYNTGSNTLVPSTEPVENLPYSTVGKVRG